MAINEQELENIFNWSFIDDTSPVTYRKFTTDEIPEYTILLSNYSTDVTLQIFASSSSYLTVTSKENNRPLTNTSFVTLSPLQDVEVLLVFNPDAINDSMDTDTNLEFIVQALETSASAQGSSSSTPSTSSGGGGSVGGNQDTDETPNEDEDVTPPSDGPNQE